jgi:hypothetical protein
MMTIHLLLCVADKPRAAFQLARHIGIEFYADEIPPEFESTTFAFRQRRRSSGMRWMFLDIAAF